MRKILSLAGVFALQLACSSDHQVTSLCSHDTTGFDITEASVLQDAQGYADMHDAVILDYDTSVVPAGATWRVKNVEIMPMIGFSQFANFQDGQSVTVEVWDGDDPTASAPYTLTQTFNKDDFEWTQASLDNPDVALETNQKSTWWSFDMSSVIPTSGLANAHYLVGVAWDSNGAPPLGYSNFNRDCSKNWTDYGMSYYGYDAGWQLNSTTSSGADTCSWPMLRVSNEILQEQAVCDNNSETVP